MRGAGLPTDGPGLLEFFRRRSSVTVEQDKIRALVEQLGDPSFVKADRAMGELVSWGPLAIPWLRQAARETDERERAAQARRCLEIIAAALAEAGATLADVVRTRTYLVDPAHFEGYARAHGEAFGDIRPANTTVVAGLLDSRWLLEIEAEAVVTQRARSAQP